MKAPAVKFQVLSKLPGQLRGCPSECPHDLTTVGISYFDQRSQARKLKRIVNKHKLLNEKYVRLVLAAPMCRQSNSGEPNPVPRDGFSSGRMPCAVELVGPLYLYTRGSGSRCFRYRSDCFLVERTQFPAGTFNPRWTSALTLCTKTQVAKAERVLLRHPCRPSNGHSCLRRSSQKSKPA